jgi:putative protein-disulfide isomerase
MQFLKMQYYSLLPTAINNHYDKNWKAVFKYYPTLTATEFSVLTETPRNEVEKILNDLATKGILEKVTIKNGAIWKLTDSSK